MIEYIIVLAFSIVLLIRPIPTASQDPNSPIAAGDSRSAVQMLAEAMQGQYRHYSYAMSIAAIPDCDYSGQPLSDYEVTAFSSDVINDISTTILNNLSVSTDRCFDLDNPADILPTSVSIENLDMVAGDIKDTLKGFVKQTIDDTMKSFLGFSLSDFNIDIGDLLPF